MKVQLISTLVGCSDVKGSKYASVGNQKFNPAYILFGDRIRNIEPFFKSCTCISKSGHIYTYNYDYLTTKKVLD